MRTVPERSLAGMKKSSSPKASRRFPTSYRHPRSGVERRPDGGHRLVGTRATVSGWPDASTKPPGRLPLGVTGRAGQVDEDAPLVAEVQVSWPGAISTRSPGPPSPSVPSSIPPACGRSPRSRGGRTGRSPCRGSASRTRTTASGARTWPGRRWCPEGQRLHAALVARADLVGRVETTGAELSHGGLQPAGGGVMTAETRRIALAGNPPRLACSRTRSVSGAT